MDHLPASLITRALEDCASSTHIQCKTTGCCWIHELNARSTIPTTELWVSTMKQTVGRDVPGEGGPPNTTAHQGPQPATSQSGFSDWSPLNLVRKCTESHARTIKVLGAVQERIIAVSRGGDGRVDDHAAQPVLYENTAAKMEGRKTYEEGMYGTP